MIRCGACGGVHPPNTLYCDECGTRLTDAKRVETEELPREPTTSASSHSPINIAFITPDRVTRFECLLKTELDIGRADPSLATKPEVDLTLLSGASQGVSRRHARLVRAGPQVLLEDLNSLNGTYLRGIRLTPHHPQSIHPGDELQFGRVVLKIQFSL